MKKVISMLVAGAMMLGTACTSTNSTTGSGTGASATGTASGTAGGSMGGTSGMSGGGTTTGGGTATGTTTSGGTMGGTTTGTAGGTTAGSTGGTTTGTAGGGTAGTSAGAGATAGTTMDMANMTDAMFMMTAASSNMLEIQAGKLASQKAMNADVKMFAQMMVDHHTKANQEMMTLASQMKVTLPKTLMPPHQALMDRLNNKTGKDFDETYMDVMETAHNMDIAMFTMKSTAAETPTVKALATKTLPMLKTHKKSATDLEDKVD